LSLNSKNAVEKLTEILTLGEKILKTAELCRRLETEKEKVLPFYENSVEPTEIPEDLKANFMGKPVPMTSCWVDVSLCRFEARAV
jgi:hypothetical protein